MTEGTVVLFLLLAFGVLGGNDLIAVSAAVMLLLQASDLTEMLQFLERYGIDLGVIFLTLGLLLPFATGKVGLAQTAGSLVTPAGVIALIVGTLAAYLAAQGVNFLRVQPEAMVGLVVGSVIGVYFLNGIPAGPLVAAGMAAFIYQLMR